MPPTCCSAGIIAVETPTFPGRFLTARFCRDAPGNSCRSQLFLPRTFPVPHVRFTQLSEIAALVLTLPTQVRLRGHWRIECNRTRGTPMRVDATLIPAAPAVPSLPPPASPSILSSFGAKLASSVSSSGSEFFQKQSAPEAKSDSKSSSNAAANRAANSIPSPNSPNSNPKAGAKAHAKSGVKLATNLAAVPEAALLPIPLPSAALPVSATVLAASENSTFPGLAPNLAAGSTNPQPLVPQLAANLDNAALPAPALQPVSNTVENITPGAFPLSALPGVSFPQRQRHPVSFLTGLAVLSGPANVAANSPVLSDARSKSPEPPSVVGEAGPDALQSFAILGAKLSSTSTTLTNSTVTASPAFASPLPPTPATPVPKATPSFDPARSSNPRVVSLPVGPGPAPPLNPAWHFSAQPSSASMLAPSPTPTPQALLGDSKGVLLSEPTNAAPPAERSSTDVKVGNSTLSIFPQDSSPRSSAIAGAPATQPAPIRESGVIDTVPTPALAMDATAAAAQSASAPETGFAATNNPANDSANSKAASVPSSLAAPSRPNAGSGAATQPVPTRGSGVLGTVPAPVLAVDASAAAAQSASDPETGSTAVSNLTNSDGNHNAPSVPSSLASSPNPLAQSPPAIAATAATDFTGNVKPGLSSQPAQPSNAATPPTTVADKKLSTAAALKTTPSLAEPVPAGSSPALSSSTVAPSATSAPGAPAALAGGRDSSAMLPAPAASAPASPNGSAPSSPFPQTHQMLDSAPAAPLPLTPAPIAPGSAADAQMNAQMHVGVRTDAFGAVEIHTVVQQSQVGITVHADREIARWFSSEVPGLESGLNKNHLNLTAVDFDSARSGVQTATGFQQGQPRQSFSQTPSSLPATAPKEDSAPLATSIATTIDILPSGLAAGPAQRHVSIHA